MNPDKRRYVAQYLFIEVIIYRLLFGKQYFKKKYFQLFNQTEFHIANDIILIFESVFPLAPIASSDQYILPGHPCKVG